MNQVELFERLFPCYELAFGTRYAIDPNTIGEEGKIKGRYSTYTVDHENPKLNKRLSAVDIKKHLAGKICLVLKANRVDGTCRWAALDIDGHVYRDDSERIAIIARIEFLDLPLYPFLSKSGGLHIFAFFEHFITVDEGRKIMAEFAAQLGLPATTEIFPKLATKEDKLAFGIAMPFYGKESISIETFKPKLIQLSDNGHPPEPQVAEIQGLENATDEDFAQPGVAISASIDFSEILKIHEISFQVIPDGASTIYAYYGLAGQGCFLKGNQHTGREGNPRQSCFVRNGARLWHTCFSDGCRNFPGHKTLTSLARAGISTFELFHSLLSESVKPAPDSKASPATEPTLNIVQLRSDVRMVAVATTPSKENPTGVIAFDKPRLITDLIYRQLSGRGEFFRTDTNMPFYFFHDQKSVLNLYQDGFAQLIKHATGLTEPEKLYKCALDSLITKVSQTAKLATVHSLAYFNPQTKEHHISNGKGGMYSRSAGGSWEFRHNGENGIYFLTEPEAMEFKPDLNSTGALKWFFNQFLFKRTNSTDDLTPDDAKLLLEVWLAQQLFPSLRQTRMIPGNLGEQGSGKTSAAKLTGRLLIGPNFKVIGVKKDGERNWIAAVTNRVFVGFDNADSEIDWMPNELARYATDQRYDMAALYKNNVLLSFSPTASIMITSRDPRFNREDVAERLIPIYFERPENEGYIEEKEIFDQLEEKRNAIWGELLQRSATFVENLDLTEKLRVRFRMADYGTFGLRWTTDRNAWTSKLEKLSRAQGEFATKDDAITRVLKIMLEKYRGTLGPFTVGELYELGANFAVNCWWPSNAQSFGKILDTKRVMLEQALNASVVISDRGGAGKRQVTISGKGLFL
jgi:TOTE conflict system, Archaeo-Eukaryotic Primase domain